MAKLSQEAREIQKQKRRETAISHLNNRIDFLTQHTEDHSEISLADRDFFTKKILFLTQVRNTTIKNFEQTKGIRPAHHITPEMLNT